MNDEQFERYLELCRRIYVRMRRENSWPWPDSQDSEDMVESKGNPENV